MQLNKGEQVHELRQFIHFANEGKIRSHLEEEQINEANKRLLINYAEGYPINDDDLRHLGPARHEHINPYGHYTFNVQQELQRKGLRPLRNP